MTSKPPARESRSVRLREDEWVTAEAIARMSGETSAGFGLRTALAKEAERIARRGLGVRLDFYRDQIISERRKRTEGKR